MDEWRAADDPACPACGESLAATAVECPACGEQLVSEEVAALLDERMSAAYDGDVNAAPRWAVLLTGLALGVAIAPLFAYAVAIAVGDLPFLAIAGLLLAGWLGSAAALARLPNPSAALARGLYLVVAGVLAVVAALGYDSLSGGGVGSDRTLLVAAALAVPAIVAALLARRVSERAARQARGEPGPLHERAGFGSEGATDESADENP
ncbi:zinc ribbon domain-containing protein [Haloarcula nitratireducens]|uniref:Zinc ribbon domain-containing protein n=1 Tax=Haloarcula nitratireducens TaxID=2487749 RepID=A0AAW4P9E7_9EURY|nr:zinc ribbon domain-containing protein [Halomicroarcula nitratireducens]MBX0294539.1 zinc ribbon domain-containing protein [Halomicroarcula nitratireducens]